MTDQDKELLACIDELIKDAPSIGIPGLPFRILREKVEALITEKDAARETVLDMTTQFAYECDMKKGAALTAGGLSALEGAFSLLGWDDPHMTPERECQHKGCHKHAHCGMTTPDGYKWLCSEHAKPYWNVPL